MQKPVGFLKLEESGVKDEKSVCTGFCSTWETDGGVIF